MPKKIEIYVSNLNEGPLNLALEDYLLSTCSKDTVILYLWQNNKTIVIGRHQNPYKECDIGKIKSSNVNLVRRKSGGGAVYQDLGNLNFTFISSTQNHDIKRQYNVILNAIESYGLKGELSGRNDLVINGAKFSGNAFMGHDDFQCHHGTLLIDTDLDALLRYLTPSPLKIKSKSIESVKARVVNLKSLNENINPKDLSLKIIDSFKREYNLDCDLINIDRDNLNPIVFEKSLEYKDWMWSYGASPSFDIYLEEKFSWGVFEIGLSTKDGLIKDCSINTDCILNEDFYRLRKNLIGAYLQSDNLVNSIERNLNNPQIIQDLKKLLKSKGLIHI